MKKSLPVLDKPFSGNGRCNEVTNQLKQSVADFHSPITDVIRSGFLFETLVTIFTLWLLILGLPVLLG